eukprot:354346-Chlamydomonas_euryale.AAC.17
MLSQVLELSLGQASARGADSGHAVSIEVSMKPEIQRYCADSYPHAAAAAGTYTCADTRAGQAGRPYVERGPPGGR